MPYTIIRQRVSDYPKWRRAFDEHADARGEHGSRGGHLFRDPEEPDHIVVFLAWADMDAARDYLEGEAPREERERGGVDGEPEVLYLEELGRPSR